MYRRNVGSSLRDLYKQYNAAAPKAPQPIKSVILCDFDKAVIAKPTAFNPTITFAASLTVVAPAIFKVTIFCAPVNCCEIMSKAISKNVETNETSELLFPKKSLTMFKNMMNDEIHKYMKVIKNIDIYLSGQLHKHINFNRIKLLKIGNHENRLCFNSFLTNNKGNWIYIIMKISIKRFSEIKKSLNNNILSFSQFFS